MTTLSIIKKNSHYYRYEITDNKIGETIGFGLIKVKERKIITKILSDVFQSRVINKIYQNIEINHELTKTRRIK